MSKENWKTFYTGSAVRWNGSMWIVSEVETKGLRLVSLTMNNVSAFPSTTWPEDHCVADEETGEIKTVVGKRVESVELVASCVSDYVLRVLRNPFKDLFSHGN